MCFIYVLFILHFKITFILGSFYFYSNKSENIRVTGVAGDLKYVENGVQNLHPQTFIIPLNINDIYYNWYHLQHSDSEPRLKYRIGFKTSNAYISYPTASIKEEGEVPNIDSVFRVTVQCVGSLQYLKADSFEVVMSLHITYPPPSPTLTYQIKRKKICRETPSNNGESTDMVHYYHHQSYNSENFTYYTETSSQYFYMGVGSVCGIIIILSLIITACYINKRKKHPLDKLMGDMSALQQLSTSNQEDMYDSLNENLKSSPNMTPAKNPTKTTTTKTSKAPSPINQQHQQPLRKQQQHQQQQQQQHDLSIPISYTDLRSADIKLTLQEVEIDASSVAIEDLIMEGSYGRIFTGRLIGSCEIIERGQVDRKVIIKTLSGNATKEQTYDFLKSGCLMKDLKSENLATLLAACIQQNCRPMLIYASSCNHGNHSGRHNHSGSNYNNVNINRVEESSQMLMDMNLKKFLLSCCFATVENNNNNVSQQKQQPINMQQLVYIGIQIAHGVHYMHKKHIIHRDLATRNCIVNNHLLVKVMDSALTTDLFPDDYDWLDSNEARPIRWLALEALSNDAYSPSSDTWAFGVLLWELMTLCILPYEKIPVSNIVEFLKDGYRLSQPEDCPNELFAMMACCWSKSPEDRPSIIQLQLCLQDFYAKLI